MYACMSHFGSGPFELKHCSHVCMHLPFWLGAILAQALYACMHACMSHFGSAPFWLRHCKHVCMHACPILARGHLASGSVGTYARTHVPFWPGATLAQAPSACLHACTRGFRSGDASLKRVFRFGDAPPKRDFRFGGAPRKRDFRAFKSQQSL